ncbi:MAG: hypothetical protein EXX96DRAFT_159795 [Benjaminiella poitrasii]|nr:MAG: hypothetical protein EXX96DRAFT_159795 [Benjaminiella poitrasii]
MITYPGKKELYTFLKSVKNPLFPSFINKYEEQIAEWSLRLRVSNSRELHMIWVSRFNDAIREARTDVALKKSKVILSKWDKFFEELLTLVSFKSIKMIFNCALEYTYEYSMFLRQISLYLFSIALGIKTSHSLITIMAMNPVAIARQCTTKQVSLCTALKKNVAKSGKEEHTL